MSDQDIDDTDNFEIVFAKFRAVITETRAFAEANDWEHGKQLLAVVDERLDAIDKTIVTEGEILLEDVQTIAALVNELSRQTEEVRHGHD